MLGFAYLITVQFGLSQLHQAVAAPTSNPKKECYIECAKHVNADDGQAIAECFYSCKDLPGSVIVIHTEGDSVIEPNDQGGYDLVEGLADEKVRHPLVKWECNDDGHCEEVQLKNPVTVDANHGMAK